MTRTANIEHDAMLISMVVDNLPDLERLLRTVRSEPDHPDFAYREEVLINAIQLTKEMT